MSALAVYLKINFNAEKWIKNQKNHFHKGSQNIQNLSAYS